MASAPEQIFHKTKRKQAESAGEAGVGVPWLRSGAAISKSISHNKRDY
jgi:hypothetical protein